MEWIIILVIVIVIACVEGRIKMNQNYTGGSNLFKNSDSNLEKDKHLDASDYIYYDKNGIKK